MVRYCPLWDYSPTKARKDTVMSTAVPVIRLNGEGDRFWFFGGGIHTWKATAAETDGAFLLFEDAMTKGKTTPFHSHPDADETLYMLEGEMLVHIDGKEHRVGPGGVAITPRGTPHAFLITSETARMLCLQTPGQGDAFFMGASEPATDNTTLAGPVDFGRVRESAAKTGAIEILGPPPFKEA
jgi:mannose-6-phosphate isomerase-like protein (cupin superfamily)